MKFIRKDEEPPRSEHFISEDGRFELKISASGEWKYIIGASKVIYCCGVGNTFLDALNDARKRTAAEIDDLTDRLKVLDVMIEDENRILETRLGHVPSDHTNETEGEKEHAE